MTGLTDIEKKGVDLARRIAQFEDLEAQIELLIEEKEKCQKEIGVLTKELIASAEEKKK